jgi:hypothetical protein
MQMTVGISGQITGKAVSGDTGLLLHCKIV